MDPVINAQYHVRQNADELQDFLRDLNQWKEEMTRKDKELKNQVDTGESILHPIRSSKTLKNEKNNKFKKRKKENDAKTTPKRISSYDYDAWSKFDVDKACEEVDVEESKSSEEETEEDEDFEEIRRKDDALEAKEKGNEFFKTGKFEQAIEYYTRGILCDPKNPILPANRALALFKLERYGAAEQDCGLAISLDSSYVKAFQRRGCARMALKKYKEATSDFQTVLKLEPGNKQAIMELKKLKELQSESSDPSTVRNGLTRVENETPNNETEFKKIPIAETACHTENVSSEVGRIFPIQIPPHLRSKKPLKRLEITEIGKNEKKASFTPMMEKEIVPIPNIKEFDHKHFSCPTTAFQFHSDWRQLQKSKEQRYNYLKNIPFENYSNLFQHSLESHILSDILRIYLEFYIKDGLDVSDGLFALSQVQRFKTLLLFLLPEDKKVLQDLFDILTKQKSSECIEKLRKLYCM